jgi:hypothetical protein
VPTRRPDKHTEVTEHARTISRNVDDFLEVERGDANRREFFIKKLILLITNYFMLRDAPKRGQRGRPRD